MIRYCVGVVVWMVIVVILFDIDIGLVLMVILFIVDMLRCICVGSSFLDSSSEIFVGGWFRIVLLVGEILVIVVVC